MNAHTPGPWRYKRHSFDSNFMLVFCSSSAGEGGNLSGYCGEANARLAAAAPELLAALESFVSWMDDPEDSAFSDEQLANARAAIAKATGESA